MRGVSSLLARGALLCALAMNTPARAGNFDGVQALANQKAAAVALLKQRTETAVATAANDRLFAAYLNTATVGESARLIPRIASMLASLLDRYGIRAIDVADRAGAFVARVGNVDRAMSALDPKTNPLLQAGLAGPAHRAASFQNDLHLDLVAPFVWHDQPEFVLTARQDFSSYGKALALGVNADRFVLMTDAKGVVLAGSNHGIAGTNGIVPGLTFDAVRKKLGDATEGEVVGTDELHYKVSYRTVSNWTVIAVERIPAPRRCRTEGARLCG